MKALTPEIFFFIVFFTSSIQSELRPDAENVCLQTETYEETIVEKVKKPLKVIKKKLCWNMRQRFSCKERATNWQMVDAPRVVQRSRTVARCCSGYKEQTEGVRRCVPVCPNGCVHGRRTAPDFAMGTSEATVGTDGEVGEETSTTEEEKEISTEIATSIAAKDPLDLTASATASTEETGMEVNCSPLTKEETGLGNFISNLAEKLNIEDNVVSTNTETILELEDAMEPTEIVQNLRVYHSTAGLYSLPAIGCLVLAFVWWQYRKKIRESNTEKKQTTLYSQEGTEFCLENLFWSKPLHNRSKSTISTCDAEPRNAQPALLDLQVRDRSPSILSDKKACILLE